jgi:hydrogenase-4 component E
MNPNGIEMCVIAAAVIATLMPGSLHIRVNLWFYGAATLVVACATALTARAHAEVGLLCVALLIAVLKAAGIPSFLSWTLRRLNISRDKGCFLPAPLAMHVSILLLGISFLLTKGLPMPESATNGSGWYGAAAGISLVFTGLVLMLTRRLAVSQILGFLVIENGIFVFALTQTRGMPLFVEMGVMLDVLVGVMICGVLVFKIQKSFEHIDVGQLTDLRD